MTTRPDSDRPGRSIPANRLDPVAFNVLKLFPLSNTAGTCIRISISRGLEKQTNSGAGEGLSALFGPS
jgi:hypothetical protein